MTITNFYGVSSADNSAAESDGGDITSVLKSRRVAAARAAEERTKKERELLMRLVRKTVTYSTAGKCKSKHFSLK